MPSASDHFTSLRISLLERQQYYEANLVKVMADSFKVALKNYQQTTSISEQKVAKDIAIVALLVTASIFGIGWTGLHLGRFVIHRAVAVNARLAGRQAKTAKEINDFIKETKKRLNDSLKDQVDNATMNIGTIGILSLIYQNTSKDTISYLKTLIRTESANSTSNTSTILPLDKNYFESNLYIQTDNIFKELSNHIVMLSEKITDESQAKKICNDIKKSPIFYETISINRYILEIKYELAFYMQLILDSDYLHTLSKVNEREAGNIFLRQTESYYETVSRNPIHTLPSKSNYPKNIRPTHKHGGQAVVYNDIGRPSEVRINHIVKELQSRDPNFKYKDSNPFMRSWLFTQDINHDVMRRAEKILAGLIFPNVASSR